TQSAESSLGPDDDHLALRIDDESVADRVNEVEKIDPATPDHLAHNCVMGRIEVRRQLDPHRNSNDLANPLQQSLRGFCVISDLRFSRNVGAREIDLNQV